MADSIAQQRRQMRLAQQLRANLLRRKQQARERDGVSEVEHHEKADDPRHSSAK
ncbi:hypothetical protein [Bartonella apis]|uniref:hypothetical protein n=1 Tax=Bartonella apis TaxID=1686310 RepID=UPI002432E736|nr:hypothetical protein [Bartonella apis]